MYDIYFDLNNMHQTVEETDDKEFWLIGEQFNFDFVHHIPVEKSDTDDYPVIVRRSKGCICKSCGEIYPYAEPNQQDGSFKCWGCRNF